MLDKITVIADVASIATGIVAVWAWYDFKRKSKSRVSRLEQYLQNIRADEQKDPTKSGDGMRSVVHLMAKLYMTESQVYDAAFASDKIKAWPRSGRDGVADEVMFQHNPKARAKD